MNRLNAAFSVLVCLALPCIAAAVEGGPSGKLPELKALDHYAGSWDTEITSKSPPFTKGTVTAKWILDGRFIQQTAEAKEGPTVFKYMSLMTYDPTKKVYRSWIFLSDGNAFETEGSWNAKDQVMISVRHKDENGISSTTTADFSEVGVEKWKIVSTDGNGKVIGEMSGKNTRQKK